MKNFNQHVKIFYVVAMEDYPMLICTLSYDGTHYHYKPYNLDTYTNYPRFNKEWKRVSPPTFLVNRTYSEGRPDIRELLAKMGLHEFDLWRMVEIEEGKLLTDNLLFLTPDGLRKYGLERILYEVSGT